MSAKLILCCLTYFLRYLRISRSMVFLVVCWYCQPLNICGCRKVVSSWASFVRFLSVPNVFSMVRSVEYWRSEKPRSVLRLSSLAISLIIWVPSV